MFVPYRVPPRLILRPARTLNQHLTHEGPALAMMRVDADLALITHGY